MPNNRNWIHELNLDPRFRVPAGFGTQRDPGAQEDYMNVAWQQVGDVLAANRLIRFAQLASEALWQWHTRHSQPLLDAQPGQADAAHRAGAEARSWSGGVTVRTPRRRRSRRAAGR